MITSAQKLLMARAGVSAAISGWNVGSASYDSVSLSLSAQEGNVRSLFFRSNGSSFYITGQDGDDVTQYDMSTAWDITSATAVSTFVYTGETAIPEVNGIWFEDDGLTFYLQDSRGNNINPNVDKYTCSTAWDISSASYASVRVALTGIRSISLAAGGSQDLFFKPDGTSFYVPDNDTDKVFQYNLSTAWDITTLSSGGDFSITSQDTVPVGVNFTPDGKRMILTGISTDTVYQYTLSTAWDITTASYDSVSFSIGSQATSGLGTRFKTDGTKMYVADRDSDALYQYSTA